MAATTGPSTEVSSRSLAEVLEQCGLQAFDGALRKLGVDGPRDVLVLRDSDLEDAGLNRVQLRVLQGACDDAQVAVNQVASDGSPSHMPRSNTGGHAFEDLAASFVDDHDQTPKHMLHGTDCAQHVAGQAVQEVMDKLAIQTSPSIARQDSDKSEIRPTSPSTPEAFKATNSLIKRKKSVFWQQQAKRRPMRLIFVRHGESEANKHRVVTKYVADHAIHLTAEGRLQALEAGKRVKEIVGDESVKFIVSPYTRTRETRNGILQAFGGTDPEHWTQRIDLKEDVRIRELEFGNYDSDDLKEQMKEKKGFGTFYYRFHDGESPADCYDRASLFLESMYRSWEDNTFANHVFVGHGMMLLVILMRFFRINVDEYGTLDRLSNCEIIVCERPFGDGKFSFSYQWPLGVEKQYGRLRRKEPELYPTWDGTPDAPPLRSKFTKEGHGYRYCERLDAPVTLEDLIAKFRKQGSEMTEEQLTEYFNTLEEC